MGFEIRIGDTRGMLNLCFPAASIEAVSGSFTRSWQRTQREMTPAEQAALDENVGRVDRHADGRDRRAPSAPATSCACRSATSSASSTRPAEPIEVSVNGKAEVRRARRSVSATRSHIRIEGPVRASRTHAA